MSATSSFPSCLSLNVDKVVGVNRFTLFMSIFLMIFILSLNAPIFLSLYRDVSQTSFYQKQFSKLLLTLVSWNLLTGILVDTSFMAKTFAELKQSLSAVSCTAGRVTFIATSTLSLISFATITAIMAQRYCRVMRYSHSRSSSVIWAIEALSGALATVAGALSTMSKAAQFTMDLLVSIIFAIAAARLFVLCKKAIQRSLFNPLQVIGRRKLLKRQKQIDAMMCVLLLFVLTHIPLRFSLMILAWKEEGSIHSMSAQRVSIVADSFCSTVTPVIILFKFTKISKDFVKFYKKLAMKFRALVNG